MRKSKSFSAVVLGCALLLAGCSNATPEASSAKSQDKRSVLLADGAGWKPGQTLDDWVTYGDYVLAVTPTDETEVPPDESEIKRGDGTISRQLTLRVDDVVWSSPLADRPAPVSMPFRAWGWHFANGDLNDRTEMAAADAPRVEKGHQYLIAVAWQQARCTPGDVVPARWRVLGSDAIVPYDDQTVGQGENEGSGQTVSQAAALAKTSGPDVPVEAKLAGKSGSAAVRGALQTTAPGKRLEFGPPASTTACP